MIVSNPHHRLHDARTHLYRMGESVRLLDGLARFLGSPDVYRVTALLPPSGASPQYRIRSDDERYERVASEACLAPASASVALTERTFRHDQGTQAQQQGAKEAQTGKRAGKNRKPV